jgi:hypothetical protein
MEMEWNGMELFGQSPHFLVDLASGHWPLSADSPQPIFPGHKCIGNWMLVGDISALWPILPFTLLLAILHQKAYELICKDE